MSEKGKHRSSRLPTVVVEVRARLEQSPKKPLRRLSQETGYTYSMCQRAQSHIGLRLFISYRNQIRINNWIIVVGFRRSLCKILPYCPSHGSQMKHGSIYPVMWRPNNFQEPVATEISGFDNTGLLSMGLLKRQGLRHTSPDIGWSEAQHHTGDSSYWQQSPPTSGQ